MDNTTSPVNTANTNKQISIAMVEDDVEISRLTKMLLEAEGYQCHAIFDGQQAVEKIRQLMPDVVLLDIMLPGLNGLEVCQQIRQFYSGAILIITGCDDDITELSSFKKGTDDFIIKPIKPHLLLARIGALLKRTYQNASVQADKLINGGLLLDIGQRRACINSQNIHLSGAEFDILELLMNNVGQVVSREQCCAQLRGFAYDGLDRSIDMRVSTLRKKLAVDQQQHIATVRGKGYMLVKQ